MKRWAFAMSYFESDAGHFGQIGLSTIISVRIVLEVIYKTP